jgi:hypothetical protein
MIARGRCFSLEYLSDIIVDGDHGIHSEARKKVGVQVVLSSFEMHLHVGEGAWQYCRGKRTLRPRVAIAQRQPCKWKGKKSTSAGAKNLPAHSRKQGRDRGEGILARELLKDMEEFYQTMNAMNGGW